MAATTGLQEEERQALIYLSTRIPLAIALRMDCKGAMDCRRAEETSKEANVWSRSEVKVA